MRALYDVAAPAKLNLFLHVVGRRADGYHLLQSAFALIDWCDQLHFERRDDARLARHDLRVALPADDLCLRAARALQQASATPFGVDISIEKHIPSGAGMGGGSSDAASTLLALNRLWGLQWPAAKLAALGLQLGADVPFFVGGENALVEGVGERLTPIEVPALRLAVIKPRASLETRAVFASPLLLRSAETDIVAGFTAGPEFGGNSFGSSGFGSSGFGSSGFGSSDFWCRHSGRNDLQAAAQALCSEVSEALALLQACFGNSRMTGSGSAVFARVEADPATVPALPAGWEFRMCRSLPRHPLAGWAGNTGGARSG